MVALRMPALSPFLGGEKCAHKNGLYNLPNVCLRVCALDSDRTTSAVAMATVAAEAAHKFHRYACSPLAPVDSRSMRE